MYTGFNKQTHDTIDVYSGIYIKVMLELDYCTGSKLTLGPTLGNFG